MRRKASRLSGQGQVKRMTGPSAPVSAYRIRSPSTSTEPVRSVVAFIAVALL
jgi:hypothetical protein